MTENVQQEGVGLYQSSEKELTIDYQLYERYLEHSGLSETQKKEFLDALWQIITSFIDLGFGVHPLQHAKEAALHDH